MSFQRITTTGSMRSSLKRLARAARDPCHQAVTESPRRLDSETLIAKLRHRDRVRDSTREQIQYLHSSRITRDAHARVTSFRPDSWRRKYCCGRDCIAPHDDGVP